MARITLIGDEDQEATMSQYLIARYKSYKQEQARRDKIEEVQWITDMREHIKTFLNLDGEEFKDIKIQRDEETGLIFGEYDDLRLYIYGGMVWLVDDCPYCGKPTGSERSVSNTIDFAELLIEREETGFKPIKGHLRICPECPDDERPSDEEMAEDIEPEQSDAERLVELLRKVLA